MKTKTANQNKKTKKNKKQKKKLIFMVTKLWLP